jgi:hypothetical protein
MFALKNLWTPISVVIFSLCLFGQGGNSKPSRDPQSIEILRRAVQAAGGEQLLASLQDITEKGEIEFYWNGSVRGPVTIQMMGGSRFRIDYEVAGRKTTSKVKDGFGVDQRGARTVPLSCLRALSLANLTFPAGNAIAAVQDSSTKVSFVDVEQRNGRSVYRLRISGQLGLAKDRTISPLTKELLIDALNYDIVSIEDKPLSPAENWQRTQSQVAQREIEYQDFRSVDGVRIPFSIRTRVVRQKTMTIRLDQVTFNSNLRDDDFGS